MNIAKIVKSLKILGVCLLASVPLYSMGLVYAAPSTIVGLSVDVSAPPPPSGFCTTALNMTDKGTLTSSIDGSVLAVFKAAPLENSYLGVGYAIATGAGSNTRVATFDLTTSPVTLTGSALINTAGVPDAVNQIRSNAYDTTRASGKMILAGTRLNAPCNVNPCIHARTFSGTSTIADTNTSTTLTVGGSTMDSIDGDSYWVGYGITGGTTIGKFNTSFTFLNQLAFTANLYGGITHDDNYVYATINLAGTYNIRRIDRTTLAVNDFALFAGTVSSEIHHVNGFLYVGQSGTLQKVRTSDMTIVTSLALAGGEVPLLDGISYDATNDRMYVVSTGGGATQFRRINLNTFTSEQTLGIGAVGQGSGVGFDFVHQNIYAVSAAANMLVMKVGLCT